MTLTQDEIIEALRPVEDPELHRSIVDLDMVRRIDLDLPNVGVAIDLTIAGCPLRAEIDRRVKDAVEVLEGVQTVTVEFGVMTDEQRAALRMKLHGDPAATAGTNEAHGHAEGREVPFADPEVGMTSCRPVPVNDPNTFMGFTAHMLWGLHHEINVPRTLRPALGTIQCRSKGQPLQGHDADTSPPKTLGEIDRHRVAIDAIEATLRDEPPGKDHLVLIRRNRRPLAVSLPGFDERVAELAAGLNQKRS